MPGITAGTLIRSWNNARFRLVGAGIGAGLIAGVIAACFRIAWDHVEHWRNNFQTASQGAGHIWVVPLAFAAMAIAAGYLTHMVPEAAGSGIPHIKAYLQKQRRLNWKTLLPAKFLGCLLSVASGLSVGREGPMLQMGAAAGQAVSRILLRPKAEEGYLVVAGLGAGLSAAFNTPLAGVMFALERIQRNFSPYTFGTALTASVTADLISQYVFGVSPLFRLPGSVILPPSALPLFLLLGVSCGFLGCAFNTALMKTLGLYERITKPPRWLHPMLPAAIGAILAYRLPEVLGGGHALMRNTLEGKIAFGAIGGIFLAKFAFTMLSYGAKVPGGIFLAPLLLGALAGAFFSHIPPASGVAAQFTETQAAQAFAILGMASFFAATVRAPMTGVIMTVEMTGAFGNMLAYLAACLSAYLVAEGIRVKPVYEMLLDRDLAAKAKIGRVGPATSGQVLLEQAFLKEVVIESGSPLAGRRLRDVLLPHNCLIVAVRRGSKELLPRGRTRIHAGDILTVLLPEPGEQVAQELERITSAR